eukprot:Lithocolla_globosa_v1_NODE_1756_length_2360_cov_297.175271.p1 type:complete len:264 gc:universal NODE_1756_length_2360_cov_297.175271:1530-739(-)
MKIEASPTGYAGLRIGKLEARLHSDLGMSYDGQYWHYIDKWLFALLRLGEQESYQNRLKEAAEWAKVLFPQFFDHQNGGIRWKLNVDSTPIGLQGTIAFPNDDTLNALIIFTLIEKKRKDLLISYPLLEIPSLAKEISCLQASLIGYSPRITKDPLGWGLELWMDQWIRPSRSQQLKDLSPLVLSPVHISMPFRLYGALFGARVAHLDVEQLLELGLNHQSRMMNEKRHEEHHGINVVMLASAILAPRLPFLRGEKEPIIELA